MLRRAAIVWLVLLAAYAATIGLDAFGSSDYGGDEPHYLLAAKSLVDDRDFDVLGDYRARAYRDFYPYRLDMQGSVKNGRLYEPHGVGFPALIAPAYAVGGAKGVELFLAALSALAIALAYLLALRVVPDPWAIGAALAVGLSPPLLAYGTAVYPELVAGAALAGAALLVLRLEVRPSRGAALACFGLLALLPWLGTKYVLAGIAVGYFAVRSLGRSHRGVLALAGVELAAVSVALYVGINEGLYDSATPYEGHSATGASFPLGYVDRSYRLAALLVDRDFGLLRWAPVFALALVGVWLLHRSRRERLARVIPAHHQAELAASTCALALGAQLAAAAFLAPTMFGFWFPGRHLVAALPLAVPLVAWGLRHAPRVGAALALVGVAASVWLYLDVRLGGGGLAAGRPDAPWGPLVNAFPLFDRSALPYALAAAAALGAAALAFIDSRRWRRVAGSAR